MVTSSIVFVNTLLVCSYSSAAAYIFIPDSSVLKDTLELIERQSHTLETHSEYLFSSILSAMDCLTDPSSEEASGKDLLVYIVPSSDITLTVASFDY